MNPISSHLSRARETTAAVRDFLRTEGRILLDPEGQLTEGGGIPQMYISGTAKEAAECIRASRAYFDARSRFGADRQIRRAVRMLGHPTRNGWIVLRAPAACETTNVGMEG